MRSAPPPALERVLRPIHLWAIAVGLVVSGDYFGWNYGVGKAGPVGMLVATGAVTLFYVAFIFSYTELSTAIPHSGGPFAYALRAFGPLGGFLAGFGTLVEFAFAPPAIALAIGAYVNFRVPALPKLGVAIAAFLVFGALNVAGVTIAATFELVVTALATLELFIFFGLAGPHVDAARIVTDPLLPHGWGGVFAALPFAIWFYLALEGVAMSAEEVVDPRRDIPKGYIAGIATLVVLALGTLVCSTGILSPEALVEDDSPLPRVLRAILSADHPMTHLMVYLGLFGLIASFHGIIMGCSRQVFALARAGYLPPALAGVHATRRTPVPAILLCVLVGGAAAASERADELIALAGLGATVLYVTSLASLFALRRKEPALERPFKAPLYPALPALALALALVFLAAYAVQAPHVVGVFGGMLALAFAGWRLTARGAAAGAPATAPGAPAGAAP